MHSTDRQALLRLLGLVLVIGGAWVSLTADWTGPAELAAAALAVLGFVLAVRDDPYVAPPDYLTAGCFTITVLVVVAFGSGFRGEASDWVRLLTRGGSGFLAIAAATSAVSRLLYVSSLGYERSEIERRFGHDLEIHDLFLTVIAATYGIPVAVATAVLVGVSVPGWPGVVVGSVAGIGVGALAWGASTAAGWGLLDRQEGLYEAAAGSPADAASVSVGVIAAVIVGASEVSEFALSTAVELLFIFIVAGVLTKVFLLVEMVLMGLGIGRLPVMGLLALACGALGLGVGLMAGELLIGGVSSRAISNAPEMAMVVMGAAAVALVVQRLGSVIGFTSVGSLVAMNGGSDAAIIASAICGAIAGAVLAEIANLALGVASDSYAFRSFVLALGIAAGIAAGLVSGLPVAL